MAVSCPEVMYGAYYPYLYGRAGPSRSFYQYERVSCDFSKHISIYHFINLSNFPKAMQTKIKENENTSVWTARGLWANRELPTEQYVVTRYFAFGSIWYALSLLYTRRARFYYYTLVLGAFRVHCNSWDPSSLEWPMCSCACVCACAWLCAFVCFASSERSIVPNGKQWK